MVDSLLDLLVGEFLVIQSMIHLYWGLGVWFQGLMLMIEVRALEVGGLTYPFHLMLLIHYLWKACLPAVHDVK